MERCSSKPKNLPPNHSNGGKTSARMPMLTRKVVKVV
jgi:hypothetical protein